MAIPKYANNYLSYERANQGSHINGQLSAGGYLPIPIDYANHGHYHIYGVDLQCLNVSYVYTTYS